MKVLAITNKDFRNNHNIAIIGSFLANCNILVLDKITSTHCTRLTIESEYGCGLIDIYKNEIDYHVTYDIESSMQLLKKHIS